MGQYYKACYKQENKKEWKCISTDGMWVGSKLMEHAYIGNNFVSLLMQKLFRNPMQLVWAGDYADNEEGYTEDEREKNLYFLADEEEKEKLYIKKSAMRYVVNKSKGIFVDLRKVKKDKYDERINPLCLLTAEGNGRGGGDFTGHLKECVGIWARDVIYVDNEKPENMTEVVYLFSE